MNDFEKLALEMPIKGFHCWAEEGGVRVSFTKDGENVVVKITSEKTSAVATVTTWRWKHMLEYLGYQKENKGDTHDQRPSACPTYSRDY